MRIANNSTAVGSDLNTLITSLATVSLKSPNDTSDYPADLTVATSVLEFTIRYTVLVKGIRIVTLSHYA